MVVPEQLEAFRKETLVALHQRHHPLERHMMDLTQHQASSEPVASLDRFRPAVSANVHMLNRVCSACFPL